MNDLAIIVEQIMGYIDAVDTVSYYDVKAYAFREKPDWIPAFKDRHSRLVIAETLKSKKRMEKRTYDAPLHEALHKSVDAQREYYSQQEKKHIQELTKQMDEMESCSFQADT